MDSLNKSILSLTELVKSIQISQQSTLDKLNESLADQNKRFLKLEAQQEKILTIINENKEQINLLFTQNNQFNNKLLDQNILSVHQDDQTNEEIKEQTRDQPKETIENVNDKEISIQSITKRFKLDLPHLDNLTAQSVFEFLWVLNRLKTSRNKDNTYHMCDLVDKELLKELTTDENSINISDEAIISLLSPFATVKSFDIIIERTNKISLWEPFDNNRIEIFKSRVNLTQSFINKKIYEEYEPYFILSIILNIHSKSLKTQLLTFFYDVTIINQFKNKNDLLSLSSNLKFLDGLEMKDKVNLLFSAISEEAKHQNNKLIKKKEKVVALELNMQENYIKKIKVRSKRNKFIIVP